MEGLVTVRRLAARDVDAVLAIQAASPGISQWSRDDYVRAAQGDGLDAWVAEREAVACAFLVARIAADEMEILNVAVAPTARRQGTATRLMSAALAQAQARKATRAFLEVRESNKGAIGFYERMGFRQTGRRPRYYSNPPEDALVLSRTVSE